MDAPRRCPRCSSDEVIRILYGTPTPDLLEEARAGRVALGAVMCFGPKHRSGCALHVSTSGAKNRRNRDLSAVLALLTLLVAAPAMAQGIASDQSTQQKPNTEPQKPSTAREFSLQPVV
jgi:hypothetical protein